MIELAIALVIGAIIFFLLFDFLYKKKKKRHRDRARDTRVRLRQKRQKQFDQLKKNGSFELEKQKNYLDEKLNIHEKTPPNK